MLVLFAAGLAYGQEIGDRVIATGDIKLRLPGRIVESVGKNTVLTVEKVNGEWLWLTSPTGRKGWVRRMEVKMAPSDIIPAAPSQKRGLAALSDLAAVSESAPNDDLLVRFEKTMISSVRGV